MQTKTWQMDAAEQNQPTDTKQGTGIRKIEPLEIASIQQNRRVTALPCEINLAPNFQVGIVEVALLTA